MSGAWEVVEKGCTCVHMLTKTSPIKEYFRTSSLGLSVTFLPFAENIACAVHAAQKGEHECVVGAGSVAIAALFFLGVRVQ